MVGFLNLPLSVQELAYMFVHFVYLDGVFVSVSGTHCFIWSVVVFVGSQCVWVELKVSVSASQEDGSNTVHVWSLYSTGNRGFQKTPGTCFLFKCLKENKHLTGKAGDFSLLASMTAVRASGPHASENRFFLKGRRTDNIDTVISLDSHRNDNIVPKKIQYSRFKIKKKKLINPRGTCYALL